MESGILYNDEEAFDVAVNSLKGSNFRREFEAIITSKDPFNMRIIKKLLIRDCRKFSLMIGDDSYKSCFTYSFDYGMNGSVPNVFLKFNYFNLLDDIERNLIKNLTRNSKIEKLFNDGI